MLVRNVQPHREKLKAIEDTTGSITYMLRLDPDHVPESSWRPCTAKEYFNAMEKHHFGGLVEVKTILNFYSGESKELVL